MSQAPGLSGTPDAGQRSSAATSASCASSARPTSRTSRATPAMTLAASIRQTASMARWVASAAGLSGAPASAEGLLPLMPAAARARLHVHQFPDMAVQVLEAVRIHEAEILRAARAAGGTRAGHQLVDMGAAVAGQRHQHLGGLMGVGHRLAGEGLEEVRDQQHHEQILARDQAGALVIGELRIELIAHAAEEGLRFLHVADRQVDEHMLVHGNSWCLMSKEKRYPYARLARTEVARSRLCGPQRRP